MVGLVDEASAAGSAAECRRLPPGVGHEAVAELDAAEDADVVLNGVTGRSPGPTLRALESGRRIAWPTRRA